jgi:hypothetical protein
VRPDCHFDVSPRLMTSTGNGSLSRSLGDRFVGLVVLPRDVVAFSAFLIAGATGDFFADLPVLRRLFQFGRKLGLPRHDLFSELGDCIVAQCDEFFDAQ